MDGPCGPMDEAWGWGSAPSRVTQLPADSTEAWGSTDRPGQREEGMEAGQGPPSSPAPVLSAPPEPAPEAQGPQASLTPWKPRSAGAETPFRTRGLGSPGSPRDSGSGIPWLPSQLGTGSRRLPPCPRHSSGARVPSGPGVP